MMCLFLITKSLQKYLVNIVILNVLSTQFFIVLIEDGSNSSLLLSNFEFLLEIILKKATKFYLSYHTANIDFKSPSSIYFKEKITSRFQSAIPISQIFHP